MLPERVSNPGPMTNESGALPIALRGPAERCIDLTLLHSEQPKLHSFGRSECNRVYWFMLGYMHIRSVCANSKGLDQNGDKEAD